MIRTVYIGLDQRDLSARHEIIPILVAPSLLSQFRRSFVSNLKLGLFSLADYPQSSNRAPKGSAVVGRPEGTPRTTPQTPPTVIKRLRLRTRYRVSAWFPFASPLMPPLLHMCWLRPQTVTRRIHENAHGRTIHMVATVAAPPTRKECKVSRLSSIPVPPFIPVFQHTRTSPSPREGPKECHPRRQLLSGW